MTNKSFKPGVIVQPDVRSLRIKEAASNPGLLSQGEYELLLLLAGKHPHFTLAPR